KELIRGIEEDIKEVEKNISQITRYTVRYYKGLKEKFGKGRERKTEVSTFGKVVAKNVAVATETIYLNAKTGFAGWGLKRDGVSVDRCSRMDDIIIFGREGTMQVSKVAEKTYVGKNPAHVSIFRKEEPKYYCMIYRDGKDGPAMIKRFTVQGVTREKMYDLTKGNNGTRVLFFSVHDTEEDTPLVNVVLKPVPRLRVKEIEINFADIAVKGRASKGNIITKHKVEKVIRKKGQMELL
ncbi:MAG: DNA topoisomerase, partial [Candidatus Marinimicrobia bacterium]|nr:DNA topoisomerase [Candidatus Neomarinimicrobiota bacterium]